MAAIDEPPAVVIDLGSAYTRCGVALDYGYGHLSEPTLLGDVYVPETVMVYGRRRPYVGDEAASRRGELRLRSPVVRGAVIDADDFIEFIRHTLYNQLRVVPEAQNLLISETPLNSLRSREQVIHSLFEGFDVPGLLVANSSVMAATGAGYPEGVLVDVGHGVASAVPFVGGYMLTPGVRRLELGGQDVAEYLCRQLHARAQPFSTSAERMLVQHIAQRHSFVALDFDATQANRSSHAALERHYELPDGRVMQLAAHERFECAEVLFRPVLAGKSCGGLDEMVFQSIQACDMTLHRTLYGNITLVGGATLTPGFAERLQLELQRRAPPATVVRVNADDDRIATVWRGGSTIAQLNGCRPLWMTKSEYDENGPGVLARWVRLVTLRG